MTTHLISAYSEEEQNFAHNINICPVCLMYMNKRWNLTISENGIDRQKGICYACVYGINGKFKPCRLYTQLLKRFPTTIHKQAKIKIKQNIYIFKGI